MCFKSIGATTVKPHSVLIIKPFEPYYSGHTADKSIRRHMTVLTKTKTINEMRNKANRSVNKTNLGTTKTTTMRICKITKCSIKENLVFELSVFTNKNTIFS